MTQKKNSQKILKLLADGKFHSGEEIGEILSISRSAVWKNIHELMNLGLDIQSTIGKGYCITNGLELLEHHIIQNQLDNIVHQHLNQLIILNRVDSTNEFLISQANAHCKETVACFAEQQEKGRGRRGRHWASPFGTNIYHSLLWHFAKDPGEILGLSLVTAIAVTRALKKYGVEQEIHLKWPNDVLWKNRKLAGVLLEMVAESHSNCSIVIGVGLNTRMSSQQASTVDQLWAGVFDIINKPVERNKLAGILLNELIHVLLQFQYEGLTPFLQEWYSLDNLIGKPVVLFTSNKKINGIVQGISHRGELILKNNHNEIKKFLSGEVSLRAL